MPGQVLIRYADESDEKERRNRTEPEGPWDYDYLFEHDRTPDTSEGWSDSGLLKRSVADLNAMSLDGLTAALAASRNLEVARKRAQALHHTLQRYVTQFTAAKENPSS